MNNVNTLETVNPETGEITVAIDDATAEKFFEDYLASVVYRTADNQANNGLPPRNDDDVMMQNFIAGAGNQDKEALAEHLTANIMRIPSAKAAQAVCRQLMASAVYGYIAEMNRNQQREELKAKLGITDERGVEEAEAIFGRYPGLEEDDNRPSLAVMASCVDMLYNQLAVAFADAAPSTSNRSSTAFDFNQNARNILPYASKRNPVSSYYDSWYNLEDAVNGLTAAREITLELDKVQEAEARKERGTIEW